MKRSPLLRIVTLASCLVFTARARSQSAERSPEQKSHSPGGAIETSVLGAGRLNPLGLSVQADAYTSWRLYASDNVALEQNYVRPIVTGPLSAARAHGGVGLVIQPASVFGIRALVQGIRYFGTFGHVHSFPDTYAPWDDDDLEKRSQDAEGVNARGDGFSGDALGGRVFNASAYVQFKVGRFLSRTEGGVSRTRLDLPGGMQVFYDPGEDILLRNAAYATFVNADALFDGFPTVGFRSGLSLRTFDARAYGAPAAARLRNVRIGPTAIWEFEGGQYLALLAHWYAIHPYRAEGPRRAVPSMALAYQLDTEFNP